MSTNKNIRSNSKKSTPPSKQKQVLTRAMITRMLKRFYTSKMINDEIKDKDVKQIDRFVRKEFKFNDLNDLAMHNFSKAASDVFSVIYSQAMEGDQQALFFLAKWLFPMLNLQPEDPVSEPVKSIVVNINPVRTIEQQMEELEEINASDE